MANTFLQSDALMLLMKWCFKLLTCQFYLLPISETFHGILFLDIHLTCFQFLTILKFHQKYLSSCEGKEYVRRKLKCISTLIRPNQSLFWDFEWIIVNLYIVRRENAGRKLCQEVIELLQRQYKESLRLPDSFLTLPFVSSSKSLSTPHLYVN